MLHNIFLYTHIAHIHTRKSHSYKFTEKIYKPSERQSERKKNINKRLHLTENKEKKIFFNLSF